MSVKLTNPQVVRLVGWYFPGCPAIERLAQSCAALSPLDLRQLDVAWMDCPWPREHLLGMVPPAAAATWRRLNDGSAGRAPILDAALALVGRGVLEPGALLWPEYEAMVAPFDGIRSLDWLRNDPRFQTVHDRAAGS